MRIFTQSLTGDKRNIRLLESVETSYVEDFFTQSFTSEKKFDSLRRILTQSLTDNNLLIRIFLTNCVEEFFFFKKKFTNEKEDYVQDFLHKVLEVKTNFHHWNLF